MSAPLPRVLIILTWFGHWPGWMQAFVESCRWNPTIDWLIATDCGDPGDLPPNVRLFQASFPEYRELAGERLGIKPEWQNAYKLCDLKPALGFIHQDCLGDYDYWGFGDLDVIYGNIRAIYTPEILQYDLISSHEHIVAGHFTLLRTAPRMRDAFQRVRGWRGLLAQARHCSFDEQIFSRLFMPVNWRRPWQRLAAPWLGGAVLREQFSTDLDPLPWVDGSRNYPTEWYWREGRLTNASTGEREFLYLHLSHWQSSRWTGEAQAPWRHLAHISQLPPGRPSAFRISREGILPMGTAGERPLRRAGEDAGQGARRWSPRTPAALDLAG